MPATPDSTLAALLEASRRELLDLGLRNPLLNFRTYEARGVTVTQEESAPVYSILVKQGKTMYFQGQPEANKKAVSGELKQVHPPLALFPQAESTTIAGVETLDGTSATDVDLFENINSVSLADNKLNTNESSKKLEKRLLNTYYTARTSLEEQGTNILYLALGMLTWYEAESSEKPRQAPLVLVPVQLERGTVAERFKLRYSGAEIESNLSLQAKLRDSFGLLLPLSEFDEDSNLGDYYAAVAKTIQDIPRWRVEENSIALGFFSFGKFILWRDLDPGIWPSGATLLDHPSINSLLGPGESFRDSQPDFTLNDDSFLDSEPTVSTLHQVLDADSSQLLALLAVHEGRNLVIQGPPGTGKSQTIANLLAEAIGAGKKVLFVAEKMAALEVVKRRLDALGIGEACLELHSRKANKKALHDELQRTRELGRPADAPLVEDQIAQLPRYRNALNSYVESVNQPLGNSHRTAQQVAGELLQLQEEADVTALPRISFANLATWSDADAKRAHELAMTLQVLLQKAGMPQKLLFWGSMLDDSSMLASWQNQLREHLQKAVTAVTDLQAVAEALAALLCLPLPDEQLAAKVLVPIGHYAHQEALDAHSGDAVKIINSVQATAQRLAELLRESIPLTSSETEALLQTAPLAHREAVAAHSGGSLEAVTELQSIARALAKVLSLDTPSERAAAMALLPAAHHALLAPALLHANVANPAWAQPSAIVAEGQPAATALTALHQDFDNVLLPEAWTQQLSVERGILVAYGGKWWRFLIGDYRLARQRLQQLWRSSLPKENSAVVNAIDAIHEVAQHEQTLRELTPLAAQLYGATWQGVQSDWAALRRIEDYLTLTHQRINQQQLPVELLTYLSGDFRSEDVTALANALEKAIRQHSVGLKAISEALTSNQAKAAGLGNGLEDQELSVQASKLTAWIANTPLPDEIAARQAALEAALPKYQAVVRRILDVTQRNEASFFKPTGRFPTQAFDEQITGLAKWTADTPLPEAIASNLAMLEAALPKHETTLLAVVNFLQLNEERRFGLNERLLFQQFADQSAILTAWLANIPALRLVTEWNNKAAIVQAENMSELLALAESWEPAAQLLAATVRQTWLEFLMTLAYKTYPALRQFERTGHEETAERFRQADSDSLYHNRIRVMQQHHQRLPNQYADGQMAILRREASRRRNHLPLRKLMQQAGKAIQAIKPVFMMSPLSVANFLPPGALEFDLVVFDEASQMKPVDAFGAIARGKQLLVVGDSKQLPPSDFFAKAVAPIEVDDEDETLNATADVESILDMCASRNMHTQPLRWHYRSLHESLIAVSNHLFYDDKLVVFPSPNNTPGALGLVYHHLADTSYGRGTTRNNLQEADAVADAVMRHARSSPQHTLGVVAFSTAQRQAIQDALELRRKQQPALEAFFNSHQNEPFFIKNLENVQGDERDVIMISIGYGRDINGYLTMNFGPINNDGGHRRLNVLITRAKRRCEVFTNITADDIDLNRSQSEGVAALKTFLNYAQHGYLNQNVATGRDMDSPFEDAVYRALTARGYTVRPQIGSQGFFIDLAVVDPDQPGRYIIGIECDGAMYHSARSARDRDRLRQTVLENVGWCLHRIWSTDWFRDPAHETDRAVAAIEEARSFAVLNQVGEAEKIVITEVPIADLEREEPASIGNTSAATPYQMAQLPAAIRQQELHLYPAGRLAVWVADVVDAESPIHVDEVTRRLASAVGATQVGTRIRNSVAEAIRLAGKMGTVRPQDDFLWSPNMPLSAVPLRDRSNLPAVSRKLNFVAPEEVAAAVLIVVRESFAVEREAVVLPAARMLGFSRPSEEQKQIFLTAIDRLIIDGQLKTNNGVLVPL